MKLDTDTSQCIVRHWIVFFRCW